MPIFKKFNVSLNEDMKWRMEMELPRTQYSQEFREQSVKFFKESGLILIEAAKWLPLPKETLKNWNYLEPSVK